ncbi:hypothetical protein L9F63_024429, partial [Diploptera punctata]
GGCTLLDNSDDDPVSKAKHKYPLPKLSTIISFPTFSLRFAYPMNNSRSLFEPKYVFLENGLANIHEIQYYKVHLKDTNKKPMLATRAIHTNKESVKYVLSKSDDGFTIPA